MGGQWDIVNSKTQWIHSPIMGSAIAGFIWGFHPTWFYYLGPNPLLSEELRQIQTAMDFIGSLWERMNGIKWGHTTYHTSRLEIIP